MLRIENKNQATTLPEEEKVTVKGRRFSVKRNLYKWHKIIGLIVVVPVIFWTLSGLTHPFMANFFKPEIPRAFIGDPVGGKLPDLSLQEVSTQNSIKSLRNFRYVAMDDAYYRP